MSQVEIEWKAFDSISLIVNRPSHDETFVDEMKLQWEQSLSDRQVQRVIANRLPTSTSPSETALFHDESFNGGNNNGASSSNSEMVTDGNIISKQLSQWGTFCLPNDRGSNQATAANQKIQFTDYGGQTCTIMSTYPRPLKIETKNDQISNPMWSVFKSYGTEDTKLLTEPPTPLNHFPVRPPGAYLVFEIEYNKKWSELNAMNTQWINRPISTNFASTQTGCMKAIKNLRAPIVAGRQYTFSVMASIKECDSTERTIDIIPYFTTAADPSSDTDNMWCYGSEYQTKTTPSVTVNSPGTLPKYALGDDGEINSIDKVRPLRLDSSTKTKWFFLKWTFIAPSSDELGPLDVLNFAFVDPARKWALYNNPSKSIIDGLGLTVGSSVNPVVQMYSPVLVLGSTYDLHAILNSETFFATFTLPNFDQIIGTSKKMSLTIGKDYGAIKQTGGTVFQQERVDHLQLNIEKQLNDEMSVIVSISIKEGEEIISQVRELSFVFVVCFCCLFLFFCF